MKKPSSNHTPAKIDSLLLRDWGSPELSTLTNAINARRAASLPVHDFITANPYDFGYRFRDSLLQEIMTQALRVSGRYSPDPLGQLPAREAVARFHGNDISANQVTLTPGTSLAYFILFRLLAKTHGEILCPAPTYPLFDDLAKIAGLKVRRYHLQRTSDQGITRWIIDPDELKFQITPHTCAIVLVSPHNPTGTIVNMAEMTEISRIANTAGIPLIMDEVFRNYTLNPEEAVPRPSEAGSDISFTLNGLSKSHYLPGIKAGWIVTEGDPDTCRPIQSALEYLMDSFLPVQEITQAALPSLLSEESLAEADRLANLQRQALKSRLTSQKYWNMDLPQAGPYICLPVQSENQNIPIYEDSLCLNLLRNEGAVFHPGHYYAFPKTMLIGIIYNDRLWPDFSDI